MVRALDFKNEDKCLSFVLPHWKHAKQVCEDAGATFGRDDQVGIIPDVFWSCNGNHATDALSDILLDADCDELPGAWTASGTEGVPAMTCGRDS